MRRVFVVGDSLFAETLTRTLKNSGLVIVVGSAASPEAALPQIAAHRPDAVIAAGAADVSVEAYGQLLTHEPDLPIIRADLRDNIVQVITSHRIEARVPDLLAAILELPSRKK